MRKQARAAVARSGPFGLYDRWPWIHVAIAGGVLAGTAASWPWALEHPRFLWFVGLALPVIALHQWEEFVFPGGFREWFNDHVCRSPDPTRPLTPGMAAANHVPLMLVYPMVALAATQWTWLGLAGLYALVADAVFHLTATTTSGRYSPGTFTALLLYLPLGFSATHHFVAAGDIGLAGLLAAAVAGVAGFSVFLSLPARGAAGRAAALAGRVPGGSGASPS